ncbi:hypothetical protein OEM_39910 [Mycobacterium intracellulare subsp. yongonense 05-1390]|nr:hypothetical protein OEM_39910 [Mycobacterium intracellulare subsp. yongonense 05-1390]ARR79586.1 hypothetical protein MOTT12_03922 [Mycobacterium intracellulare subsp. yongonense]
MAIASAAEPGAAGRHAWAGGDRKRGGAGRGGSPRVGRWRSQARRSRARRVATPEPVALRAAQPGILPRM